VEKMHGLSYHERGGGAAVKCNSVMSTGGQWKMSICPG